MSYNISIASAINSFLKNDDWKFSFDEDKGVFTFNLSLNCKLQKISYRIIVLEGSYTVYTTVALGAKDVLPQMAEFVCRANYGLRHGNFELDFRDGEIRYKCFIPCKNMIPNADIIKDSIYVPAAMMEKYGNGIAAVSFGMMTPEEAVNASEKEN